MTTSPNKMSDEDMGEILKQAFAGTVTVREITEGEKMKYHPYWAYVNGKLFCFDFNFFFFFDLIKQHREAYANEVRIDEVNQLYNEHIRRWDDDECDIYKNRIAELKAQQEEV